MAGLADATRANERADPQPACGRAAASERASGGALEPFIDQVVRIGRQPAMVGIATSPAGHAPADLPAVVILNTGIAHRTGHNRKYVKLSRKLAAAGYRVLRFDLSGIGDSSRRTDLTDPVESVTLDVREAIDWVEANWKVERAVLVGLCSGADIAVLGAARDQRVVGIALIDPTLPITRRFIRTHVLSRLTRIGSWRYGITHVGRTLRLARLVAKATVAPESAVEPSRQPNVNERQVRALLADLYAAVIAADDRILGVFTGGMPHQHNYREQLIDAFPQVDFAKHLTLEYLPDFDHLFTSEAREGILFGLIMDWLAANTFRKPAAAAGSSPKDKDEMEVDYF